MGRAAADGAVVVGKKPSGARVWEGGADGCADDCYHHCLGEGDGTPHPAQKRQAGRAEGCRVGGEGTRADGRVWELVFIEKGARQARWRLINYGVLIPGGEAVLLTSGQPQPPPHIHAHVMDLSELEWPHVVASGTKYKHARGGRLYQHDAHGARDASATCKIVVWAGPWRRLG
jgi:hypothetical protein